MKLSEIIDQVQVRAPASGGDVTSEALNRGWLLPFAEGQYVYGPEWTALTRCLQAILLTNQGCRDAWRLDLAT